MVNKYDLLFVADQLLGYHIHPEFVYKKDKETGCEWFFYQKGSTAYIGFYGSNEDIDWKTNLWFIPTIITSNPVYDGMKIHSGYFKSYCKVRFFIYDCLINCIQYINSICILGFSMGGGIAPLAALDIAKTYNYFNLHIYCFLIGNPKVFDRKGVLHYNEYVKDTYHIIHNNDIVPRLPLFGFKHVGKCWKSTKTPFNIFLSIKDHDKVAYKECFRSFITSTIFN